MFKEIASCVVVVAFVVFCVLVVFPSLPSNQGVAIEQNSFKGVLNLWHIECFEGGSASRLDWLKQTARAFEKKHVGVLFNVVSLTAEQAKSKLENGETFSIVSFSQNAGATLFPYLKNYTGKINVLENYLRAGQIENEVFAVPYCCGGYCYFARLADLNRCQKNEIDDSLLQNRYLKVVGKNKIQMSPLGFGAGESCLPEMALALNLTGVLPLRGQSQFGAYENFVLGKSFVTLLGTQRDLFRLENKLSQGKISELCIEPIETFTDLVQFAGISKNVEGKLHEICVEFLEYLQSDNVQQTLSKIGMFSCGYSKIYTSENYVRMENALKNAKTINVFLNGSAKAKLLETCIEIAQQNNKETLQSFFA